MKNFKFEFKGLFFLIQIILLSIILSACPGKGNSELQSGALGLKLSIEKGGNQILENPSSISGEITLKLQNSKGAPSQNSSIVFQLLNPDSGAKLIAKDAVTDSTGTVKVTIVGANDFGKKAFILATVAGTTIEKKITVAIRDKIVPTRIEIVQPPATVVANAPYTVTLNLTDNNGRVATDPAFNTEITVAFGSISGKLTNPSYFNKTIAADRIVKFVNGVGYLKNIQYKVAETINLTLTDHGKIPALELITGRKMNLSDAKSMKIVPDVPTRLQLKDPNDATTDDTIIVEAKLYDQFDNFAYNYTNLCNINLGLVGAGGNNPWIIDASDLTARPKTGAATFSNGSATYSVRDSSVESVTATVTSIAQGCGGISALGSPVSFLFNVGAISKIVFRTPVPTQAKTTGEIALLIESTDSFGNLNNSYNGTVKVGFDQACHAQINAADNASGVVTLNSGAKTIRVFNRNLNRNQSVTCTVSFSGTPDSNLLDLTSTETLTFIPGLAKQLAFTNTTYQGKVGWGTGPSQRNPSSVGVELLDYYGNPIFSYAGGGTAQVVNNGSAVVVGSVAIGTNGKGSASIYNTKNETVTLGFSSAPAGIRYSVANTESVVVNAPVNLTSSLYFEWGVANYFEMVQPVAGNVDNPIPVIIKAYDYGDNLVQDYGIPGTPISDLKLISNSGTTSISNTIDFVSGVAQVNLSNTKEEIVQLSMALQSGITFLQNSKGQNIDFVNAVRTTKSAYFKWGDVNRKFILNGDSNLTVDGRARLKLQILDQYDNPVRDYGCDSITADVKLNADGGAKLSASPTFNHSNLANYNSLNSLENLDVVIQSGACSTLTVDPSLDLTSDASFGYLYLYDRLITPIAAASQTINVTVSDINAKGYSISPAGGYQVSFSPGALAKYTIDPVTGTVDNGIKVAVQAKDQFDNHITTYVANGAAQFRWVTQGSAGVVFNGIDNRATGDLSLDFLSGQNGQAYIYIGDQVSELVTVGLENITGIDTSSTASMTFDPGIVTEIALYPPTNLSTITTDDKSLFTLKTLDQYGNHNTLYGQPIKVSIADPNNIANSAGIVTNPTEVNPDNYVLIPEKAIAIANGVGTFYAYDKVAETVTFNLIDTLSRSLTLNPVDVVFHHGVATKAILSKLNGTVIDSNNLSAQVSADISAVAVVTVTDRNNNKALSYNNDFSLNIDSGVAELRSALPATTDLPSTSVNQTRIVNIVSGEGTLYVLARRSTPVNLSLIDSQGSGFGLVPKNGVGHVTLNVIPGIAKKYGMILNSDATILGGDLNALPTMLGQGNVDNDFNVTINAYDQYNNVATAHNDNVYFQVAKNAKVRSSSLPVGSSFMSVTGDAAIVKIVNGTGGFKIYDRTAENSVNLNMSSASGTNAAGLSTTHLRSVNFSFGAPNYFAIIKPASANSVESVSPVRVEVRDQYHNIVSSGFQGAVDFSVNGGAFLNNAIDINAATGLPATKITTRTINFSMGNSGFALINVYDRKAEVVSYSLSNGIEFAPGTGTLLTTDQANPTEIKEQTFFPGIVTSFAFTAPSVIDAAGNHVTADNALLLEAKAYDKYSNFADNFTSTNTMQVAVDNGGNVVSSSDQITVIPNAKISFGGFFPPGISRFYMRNTLAGVTNVSLLDYTSAGYTSSGVSVKVAAGVAHIFKITNVQGRNDTATNPSLSPVTDNPIEVSVTAYDAYSNIDLTFSGSVDFKVVSDVTGGQSWIGGTTLSSFSNGVGIKQFTKRKVGTIVVGLTTPVIPLGMDVSNPSATTTIYVNHGAPTKYGFNATTGPYVAGQDVVIDVEARDTYDNRATVYSGPGKDVNVQFTNGTAGTFKDAGSYVAGPYLVTFNSGLATITIRKDALNTSYPTVGETLTLGFLAASDTTMDATATKNYNFLPSAVDCLSVVLDPSANGGNVSPYSIDNFVVARVEARDQYGNFNDTFTDTFDFTVNKNAWLWQNGVIISAQDQTIQSANLAITSGVANIQIGDFKAETNVNLVPSNSAAAVTTFEPALIDFVHGAGKAYELVFTDYPSISNPSFDTDKATPMLLNVIDQGGNRVLNYVTHDVGLTSVSASTNTFEGLTGTTAAGIPYVSVVNGQAGFSYRGRAIGKYTLNVSDSLKDNALSKANTARSITVLPGTVSKLVIDTALALTADDLLVGDPLAYSQGACPAAVHGAAVCPKPLKKLTVLPKDQFDNVNDIEGTKSYSVSLIAQSTSGNINRWSEPIKIIGAEPFMADGVTPFNQQLVRAEDVTLNLASVTPSSQLDANGNTVTMDISSQVTRTVIPGLATKMWIVQPADNTIDFPIEVAVEIQDGQDIDGNGNGNIVSSADPKAIELTLSSSNPTWTGLGATNPNDGDLINPDSLNGSTITVLGGVGVFKLETAIAENVDIGLTAAAPGITNRFTDGANGIYFNVANMAKTVTFSPGAPTQYAIKPKPANGTLYDSAQADNLKRFNFPVKIYDKGGNEKPGVTGKVTVQASIPGGTVTLYNSDESLSSTSGQLTLDVLNGAISAKFTTSKAGTVSLSLLQATGDPLANMNVDSTVHQILVLPGAVKKLAIVDPTDIKTTASIVVADAALASSMNTTPVVVRAYDLFDNFVSTYTGPSVFLNGDSLNMEIVDFIDGSTISNSSAFSNGEAFFKVRNKTAEVVNLTLSDNTNILTAAGIDFIGVQAQQNVQFSPGLVAQYSFEVPAKYLAPGATDATADGVISLQVFARDIYGNHNTIAAESTYPTDLTLDLTLPSGATGDFANTIGLNSGYTVPITNGVGNFDVRIRKFAADRFDAPTGINLGRMSGKEGATLNFASSANSYGFMASKRIFFKNGTATYLTMEDPDPSLSKTTDDTVAIHVHARDQYENLDVSYSGATVNLATTGSSVLAGGASATFAAGIASKNITNTRVETVTLSMTASTGAVAFSTALSVPFINDGFSQSQNLRFNPGAPTSYFFAAAKMASTQTVPSTPVGPLTQDSSLQHITVDNATRIYIYAVDAGGNIITTLTDTTTGLYTVSANNSGSVNVSDPAYGNFTNGEGSIVLSDHKSETLRLTLTPSDLSLGRNTADITFDHGVVTNFAWSPPSGTTIDQLATVTLQAKDQYNNDNIKYNGTLTTSGGPAVAVAGIVNMEPYVATLATDYDPTNNSHLQQTGGYNISMTNGTASVKLKALRATTFFLSVDAATPSVDLGTLGSSLGSISFVPGVPKYFEIVDPFNSSYNVYTSSSAVNITEDAIAGTLNSLTTDSYTHIGFQAIDTGGNISTSFNQINAVSVTAAGNIDFKSTGATAFTPQETTKGVSFTNGVGQLDMRSKDAATIALHLTGFTGGVIERGIGQKSVTFTPGSVDHIAFTTSDTSTTADTKFMISLEAQDQFGNHTPNFTGSVQVIDKGTGTLCSSLPSLNFNFSAGVASRNDLQCTKAGNVILGLQNVAGTTVPHLPATHNLLVTHGTTNLRLNLYAISDVTVSNLNATTTNVRVEQQDQYGNRANTLSTGSGFPFHLNLSPTGSGSAAAIKTTDGIAFSTGSRLFTIPDNTGFLDIQLRSTLAQSVNANLTGLPAGYNLVPSSGGRTFQFLPGAANSLVFSSVGQTVKTTQNVVLGIQAQDSFHNNTSAGGTVTVNASDSTSLVLGSTGAVPLTNGVGSITIQRTKPTVSSVSFTMSGTSLDVTGQTFLLTVVPGEPSQILFNVAPIGATADSTAVNINFTLADAYSNPTTASASSVNATLQVTGGSAVFNASNGSSITANWAIGAASQKSVAIHDHTAETVVISVASATYNGANLTAGSPLSVIFSHGAPTKYAFGTVPLNPKTDQTPQLTVELQDQYGNVATSVGNKNVTLTLNQSSGTPGAFSGGGTKTLSAGAQSFGIGSATQQVLLATISNGNGYANPTPVSMSFGWGAAASLSFEVIPAAVQVGNTWQIKAAVLDAKSNKLIAYSGSAQLNLNWSGSALVGGGSAVAPTFSSPQSIAFSGGSAQWSMTGQGSGSLTVTATKVSGTGNAVDAVGTISIASGDPTKIIIGAPGSDGIISAPTTVQVYLQDSFGNSSKYTGNITFNVRAGQNAIDTRGTTNTGYHNVTSHPTSRAISFANANNGHFNIGASASGWTNVYVPTPPSGISMQSSTGVDFYFLPGTPVEYRIVYPTTPSAALFSSTVAAAARPSYHAVSGVPQTLKIQAIDVTGAPSVNWGGCVNVTLGANARPQVSTVCLTSGEGTFEFYDEFVETIPVSLADQSSDHLHDGTTYGACSVANACTATLNVGKSRAKEIRISNVATNSPLNQSAFPASLYSYPVIRSRYGISSGSERIVSTATVYDESGNVFTNYKANYSIGGCYYHLNNLSTFQITNGTANLSCSDPYKRTLGVSANSDASYSGTLPINRIGQNYRSTNNTISKFVLYCDGDNIVATDEQQSCFIRATDSYGWGSTTGLQNNSVSEVEGLSVDLRLEDNGGNLNPHSTGYIDVDKSMTFNTGDTTPGQGLALPVDFSGTVNLTSADSTHDSNYIHKRFLVANTTQEFVNVKLANIAYTGSIWSAAQISAVNTAATQSIYFTPAATANFEIASVIGNVQDPALATSNDGQFYEITLNAKTASGNIATTENGFLYLDVSGGTNPLDLTKVRMKNGVAGSFSNTNSVLAQFSAGIAKVYVSSASQGDLVFSMRLPGATGEGFINNNVAKSFSANNASQLAIVAPTSSIYADIGTYNIQLQALDNFGNIDTTFGNAVTITLTKDSDSSNQISKVTNLVAGKITFASGVATLNIATDQDGAHTLGASYAGITSASLALNFLLPIPDQIVRSDANSIAAGSVDLSFRAEKNGVLATNFSGLYDISYKNTSNVVISDGSITGPSTITITNGLGSLTVKSTKGQTLNIVFTESFTNGAHPTFSSVTGLVFATGTPDHLTITSAPSGEHVLGGLSNLSIAVKDSVGSTVTDATMNVSLAAHDGAGCSSLNNTGFTYSSVGTAVSSGVATFTSLNVASNRTMSIQAFDTSASPITAACSTGTIKVYTPLAINIVGGVNTTIGQAKVVEITGGLGTISLSPFTSALGSTATLVTSADASCNTAHCIKYTAGTTGGTDAFTIQDSATVPNQVNGAITIQVPDFTFLNGTVAMGAPFNMGQFVNTASGSQTITIKNTGNAPSGTITTTVTKDTATMWTVQNDFCSGANLAVNATCNIILVFDSQLSGATPAAYQASIAVDSPNISTTTTQSIDAELLNPLEFLDGNNADALLGATLNEGAQLNASGDVVFTIKVRHSSSSSQATSGSITITQPAVSNASYWSVNSSACSTLTTGSTCNVAVTFHAGVGVSAAESITIRASSANTGQQDLTINASSN